MSGLYSTCPDTGCRLCALGNAVEYLQQWDSASSLETGTRLSWGAIQCWQGLGRVTFHSIPTSRYFLQLVHKLLYVSLLSYRAFKAQTKRMVNEKGTISGPLCHSFRLLHTDTEPLGPQFFPLLLSVRAFVYFSSACWKGRAVLMHLSTEKPQSWTTHQDYAEREPGRIVLYLENIKLLPYLRFAIPLCC